VFKGERQFTIQASKYADADQLYAAHYGKKMSESHL
jgi:hypothetical protein